MTKQFTQAELQTYVDKTHPGLGGHFSAAVLTKGVTPRDDLAKAREKVQRNLTKKLNETKKIIWTQDPKTKKHYGYGRAHIRYALEHESSKIQYTANKQLMNEEDFEEYTYEINFWNLVKKNDTCLSIDDLLAAYHHELAEAKELCARDYEAVVNPKKLGWLHHLEALYADGVGKNQYTIEEINPDNLTHEEEEAGKVFSLEKSNYGSRRGGYKNLTPDEGCTLHEAMKIAQKDHTLDLARQAKRSNPKSK